MPELKVGIDLSVSSPGLAILDTGKGKTTIGCFQQRKREPVGTHEITPTCSLEIMPPIPRSGSGKDGDQTDWDLARYTHVVKHIVGLIEREAVFMHRMRDVDVYVEGYAFAPREQSGSAYKLRELCGILKYEIKRRNPEWGVHTISIGTWRKTFTAAGNTKKPETVLEVCRHLGHGGTQALFETLRLPIPECATITVPEFTTRQAYDELRRAWISGYPKVPTPMQDICDSFGIVTAVGKPSACISVPYNEAKKKKKKKMSRKRKVETTSAEKKKKKKKKERQQQQAAPSPSSVGGVL